jgi:adenylosuccinate lyase
MQLNVIFTTMFSWQAELDAMKALVAQLTANQAAGAQGGASGPDADSAAMIADLQAKLAAKQNDLATSLGTEELLWCTWMNVVTVSLDVFVFVATVGMMRMLFSSDVTNVFVLPLLYMS